MMWAGSKESVQMRLESRDWSNYLQGAHLVVDRAAAASINKALRHVRPKAVRQIAREAKVSPQRPVRRRTKMDRATAKKTVGALRILQRAVRAIAIAGVRDTTVGGWRNRKGSGVRARGHHWGHSFIARSPNEFFHVFTRKNLADPHSKLRAERVPIQDEADKALRAVAPIALAYMHKIYPNEFRYRMEKTRGSRLRTTA